MSSSPSLLFCFLNYGYCLAGKTDFCPLGLHRPYHHQSSASPISPTHSTPNHSPQTPREGSAVSIASDCSMATILSLLSPVYINRCVTGLWSPSSVLCRTEFDTPVFRKQCYISSKCLLYCKNAETL